MPPPPQKKEADNNKIEDSHVCLIDSKYLYYVIRICFFLYTPSVSLHVHILKFNFLNSSPINILL